MKNETNCLICGDKAILIEELSGYQEPDSFKVYECQKCDTSFSLPLIDTSSIYENIYRNSQKIPGYNRYDFYHKKVKKVKKPLEYLAKSEEAYWVVKEALSINRISGKILEVGSGLGYLTYSLRKEGFDVIGLDISENAVSNAINNFGDYYLCEDVNKYADNHEGEYDAIILTEVIEHLNDPITMLKSLIKILKIGGIIILTTPNKTFINSSNNLSWAIELPPIHYFWFSEKSMKCISNIISADISFIDFTKYYSEREPLILEGVLNLEPFLDENGLLKKKYDINPKLIKIKFQLSRINFFVKLSKILFKKARTPNNYKLGKRGFSMGCIFQKK